MNSLFPNLRDEDAVLRHKVGEREGIGLFHDLQNCQLCALLDTADQAYRALLLWEERVDPDADFLSIEKHLKRAVGA